MNIKIKAKNLKTNIPAIFLALKKKETPVIAKVFAMITIGYALSPIDLIPDFIPVLGYLDDIILLPAMIALTIRFIPDKILIQCQKEAAELWKNGKPQKWYYAIPILFIWALALGLIIKIIFL